jgi:DNA polymerase III epsilon subunit family exonuclease
LNELLHYSLFYEVLFPDIEGLAAENDSQEFALSKVIRFKPKIDLDLRRDSIVVFDFETTGLDARDDRIIEIGAVRLVNMEPVAEFSTLINPEMELPEIVRSITGITEKMLEGQPTIGEKFTEFLTFLEGSVLIAHNAEFDMGFLTAAAARLGYQIDWPCLCTLKFARTLLNHLESKSLDALAAHYQLSFEARHRSIGDVKVTSSVLKNMLDHEGKHLQVWQDFQPFTVN